MGIRVAVYRNSLYGDCTLGGISSNNTELTLVNVPGPFEPTAYAPAAILESHTKGCLRIIPDVADPQPWFMFGGNYAACSDSRVSETCEKLLGHRFYGAIAIHDRIE